MRTCPGGYQRSAFRSFFLTTAVLPEMKPQNGPQLTNQGGNINLVVHASPPAAPVQPAPMQPAPMQPAPMQPVGHLPAAAMHGQIVQMQQMQQGYPAPQIQQPYVIINTNLGDSPCMTRCSNCQQQVQTKVEYKAGGFAWLMCFVFIFFGCILGCCLIPFFADGFKDAHHSCPNCHQNLHVHKRL
ncbi:lipopolysaccharide-induced tumor necrosis factor-alpha factor homolog isoform X2 [Acipenser ruthenus]|uniref:lipopolysaccharide-induced tumor necrosis factor-alpha factor homolog isoform X2 n=1 Tax=Acipenser ruthenus TaxID=7906 RepID=UPI0027423093|nr:lipopolysaccharide-induced tumor necrosis factor-alpha factor homolog isoform X2 [Acipenser ruthenus]